MTSQKRNRLAAAVTVNVVILLVVLVAVMVYQLVTIFILKDRKNELEEQITDYYQEIESMSEDINYYQTIDGLNDLIIEYGLYKK